MAHKPLVGRLPCQFCNRIFHGPDELTVHLDTAHQNWVDVVLERLGLPSPEKYPIVEYRRALAEAFAAGGVAAAVD